MPFLGLFLGLLLSILNIVPWALKLIITLYDFIYVIGLGFINWANYEYDSMKYRSRPIRPFRHKRLVAYNFLYAKGN